MAIDVDSRVSIACLVNAFPNRAFLFSCSYRDSLPQAFDPRVVNFVELKLLEARIAHTSMCANSLSWRWQSQCIRAASVQDARHWVGHLPFRSFVHQTHQIHLVVVIVCLVLLPASRLRLHSSISFQPQLRSQHRHGMGACFALSFAKYHVAQFPHVQVHTQHSIILFSSSNFPRSAAVTTHGNLHGSSM